MVQEARATPHQRRQASQAPAATASGGAAEGKAEHSNSAEGQAQALYLYATGEPIGPPTTKSRLTVPCSLTHGNSASLAVLVVLCE